ncbi:MAG: hypothetical protein KUG81_04875 [Gammaproteobacteria bacterium]|nr:hypothetical protein [Gammaproteobacteria bacterium]
MAASSFRRDLAISQIAVDLLLDYLADEQGYNTLELEGKEAQKQGDITIEKDGVFTNIEVKYDMYAKRSGNLCFEMSNGKKMTGIMTTPAAKVYYVVPQDGGSHKVLAFDTEKLRAWIQDPVNVTIKNGGDKKKFVLALAKIEKIIEAGLPEEVFEIE